MLRNKPPMRHIVVLIPGSLGSVLQKDGQDIWPDPAQVIWKAITSLGESVRRLEQLKLNGDDYHADYLGDGITATRLMPDAILIPGFKKIDGYSKISQWLQHNLQFKLEKEKNFFDFPYDWRRDNRVSARLLQRLINDKLPQWRESSGYSDAKVILLAHSMGGLVARHYLEVLEGWKDCKALITFGTPYLGSVKILDYLANGYKKIPFLDLTEVVRSFTSAYQLLPIYEMLKIGDNYQRVAETQEEIPGVNKTRAKEALNFHRDIENAVNNRNSETYIKIPFVGVQQQDTFQSAELVNGKLVPSWELPPNIDSVYGDGDDTVPSISAVPIELQYKSQERFLPQRHGSLHNDNNLLTSLRRILEEMNIPSGRKAIRGELTQEEVRRQEAISLYLDDVYLHNEPIELRARLLNLQGTPREVRGRIELLAGTNQERILDNVNLHLHDEEWVLTKENLPPGLYRLKVEVIMSEVGANPPPDICDIFAVV